MTKLKRFGRSHPALVVIGVVVLVAGAAAAWAVVSALRVEPSYVYFGLPTAPELTASGPDQTVYRIDASRSSVTYEVEEQLAGTSHSATGSTKGIAGDILIDTADPSKSQVGEVVVNVQQLTSDQGLRDNRLRHDYLQSDDYPLATFRTTSIDGMPGRIEDGTDYEITLHGELTVKETTAPVDLSGTARRDGDEVKVRATTTVQLSTFDVGPISLIGFVSTGDDAVLTLEVTAVDAARLDRQAQLAAEPTQEVTTAAGGPSFAATVQPVLERNCASCHKTGEAGAPVWQLDTAGDAAEVANGLGLVVKTRYMPPWPASDASIPFQHSLRLSDDDLNAVVAWADAGGPLDVDPSTPIADTSETVAHPERDLELRAAEPYQGSPALTNDYRCFVLDPGNADQPLVATGYEFIPDQVEFVHHALVYQMHGASREAVEARDAADDGSGYQCFGGVGAAESGLDPSGRGGGAELVGGWAPGQLPVFYPDGAGLRIDPGDFFVLQIHYHFVHEAPADSSTFALQLADDDPGSYDRVRVTTYLAPAEIPCNPDESGPLCDRDAVLEQLAEQYGPAGPSIANGLHLLCGTSVEELAATLDDGVATSSCDHRIRRGGRILAVLGHMHEIGKTYRMTLNPGTPEEKVLLDIPNWDFGWQLNYAPQETIELKKGDVIRVECSWDRSLIDPANEPRWVTWSEGTEDEMCFSTIATIEPDEDPTPPPTPAPTPPTDAGPPPSPVIDG